MKTVLNNMIRILMGNGDGDTNGCFNSGQVISPRDFSRLDRLVYEIIERITELAKDEVDKHSPNRRINAYTFRLSVQDLLKLIELNRNMGHPEPKILTHEEESVKLDEVNYAKQSEIPIEESKHYRLL